MIHYTLLGYMVAAAIVMIACVIAYRVLMENKTRPSLNRMTLIAILGISFLLPLMVALIPESPKEAGIEIGDPEFAGLVGQPVHGTLQPKFSFSSLLPRIVTVYYLGIFISFLLTGIAVLHLFLLIKKSKLKEIEGTEVYIHHNKGMSSFSWFNKIFIYEEAIKDNDYNLNLLLSHEKAHLERAHWMDLAIAQLVLIFQWFNPAAWFIRKELQRIHEYEADEAVLSSGIDEKTYQLLLIRNISGSRYSGLTDGLNNCSLKKRIIMMKKTKFKKDWVIRGMAVCGFAILGGLIIHIPAVASVLEEKVKLSEPSDNYVSVKINPENLKSDTSEPTEFYVDDTQVGKDDLKVVDLENVQEVKIDKTTEPNKVTVITKEAKEADEKNTEKKEKGFLPQYPDAYISVDKAAEYDGGQLQLMKDLATSIQYPEEAIKEGIQGRVVVRFQVNTNGTLSNCEVAHSPNPILDEAALKAVENLPRKWVPAEVGGQPVASVFNLPVTFKLTASDKESK